jgi:hypothetical protein
VLATFELQSHYFNRDLPHYRLNPAGLLHAQIGALAGIKDYIDTLYDHHFDDAANGNHMRAARVFELLGEHETVQSNRILDAVRAIPDARVMGQERADSRSRAVTIAFTVDGLPSRKNWRTPSRRWQTKRLWLPSCRRGLRRWQRRLWPSAQRRPTKF